MTLQDPDDKAVQRSDIASSQNFQGLLLQKVRGLKLPKTKTRHRLKHQGTMLYYELVAASHFKP